MSHPHPTVPDHALDAGDYFEGGDEESSVPASFSVTSINSTNGTKPSQLKSQPTASELLRMHQHVDPASLHTAAPTERDPLLATSEQNRSNPPSSSSSNSSSSSAPPSSRPPLLPRGSISLPADYPSPPRESSSFRPYPLATGHDENGPFEVFPKNVHPPGRHYHTTNNPASGVHGRQFLPCPPCVDQFTAHKVKESFTIAGWVVGICCFPCGLLCCCFMKEKKCEKCEAVLE